MREHTCVSGVCAQAWHQAHLQHKNTRTFRSTQFLATSSGPGAAAAPGIASAADGLAGAALAEGPRQAGRVQVVPLVTLFPQNERPVFLSFRSTQLAATFSAMLHSSKEQRPVA